MTRSSGDYAEQEDDMTTDEIITKRVAKYTADIARHVAPSQPDGVCRCGACAIDRSILAELGYIQMAARNLGPRSLSLSATREQIARTFFEAGQKKAAEFDDNVPTMTWDDSGDEQDQVRSLFLAGADALLAMIAEKRTGAKS